MTSTIKATLLLTVCTVTLLVLWLFYTPESPPDQMETAAIAKPEPSRRIDTLEQRITWLESQVTDLQLRNEQLESEVSRLSQAATSAPEIKQASISKAAEPKKPNQPSEQDQPLQTLQQQLTAIAIPQDTIIQLEQLIDQNRLKRLEVRNQAVRDGSIGSVEFSEQMASLADIDEEIRQRFGDSIYDRYLYASEQPNRIRVREVFSGSAAEFAGILPGDLLLSYANQDLYSMSELRQLTVSGTAGEPVLIEIERDSRRISASAPRGTLGISMDMILVKPDDLR